MYNITPELVFSLPIYDIYPLADDIPFVLVNWFRLCIIIKLYNTVRGLFCRASHLL